jgi:hypothetical protein
LRDRERERRESGGQEKRFFFSGFEGFQAVPARPSGRLGLFMKINFKNNTPGRQMRKRILAHDFTPQMAQEGFAPQHILLLFRKCLWAI